MISWRPSVNQYVSVRLLGAVVRGRRFLLFSRIFLQEPSPSLPPAPAHTPLSGSLMGRKGKSRDAARRRRTAAEIPQTLPQRTKGLIGKEWYVARGHSTQPVAPMAHLEKKSLSLQGGFPQGCRLKTLGASHCC